MTPPARGPEPASETGRAVGGQALKVSRAAAVARRSGTARGWLRARKAVAALLLAVRLAGGAPGCRPASRRPPHEK
jgi:hypothetical protein